MSRYTAVSAPVIRLVRGRWVEIVLSLVAVAMSVAAVRSHGAAFSPVDEWMYYDYLLKLPFQGFVREGEYVGAAALNAIACNGVQAYGMVGPACGTSANDLAAFPYGGIQYSNLYTPVYFGATWIGAKSIGLVLHVDFLTAARLTGSLWSATTVIMLAQLFRAFRVRPLVILAIGLCFLASPFAWWSYSFISTDAPSVLIGVIGLLLAHRYLRGAGSGWWIVVWGAAAVVVKASHLIAIGVVVLYLAIDVIARQVRVGRGFSAAVLAQSLRCRGPYGAIGVTLYTLLAGALVEVSWLVVVKATSVGPPPDLGIGRQLAVQDLLGQVVNFLPNTMSMNSTLMPHISGAYAFYPQLATALSWLCIGGVVAAAWTRVSVDDRSIVASTTFIAALLAGPVLAVVLTLTAGEYYLMPGRYGAPLIGAFLLSAALALRNRVALVCVLAFGAGACVFVLVATYSA